MKFHECRLKGFLVTCDTNLKYSFFTIQGQITHFGGRDNQSAESADGERNAQFLATRKSK